MEPKLYLCATPIGNMKDITLRTLETLAGVDAIYAEDTRNSLKLLNRYEIKKPLISCHEHNEAARAEEITAAVSQGRAVAFISDAGMPGVSDPGARLIAACIESGTPFEVLPGACAAVTANVIAAFSDGFVFYGFLPRTNSERKAVLERLKAAEEALVFYESPLRVQRTLADIAAVLGDRECALVRELTKLHEECVRGTLLSLSERFSQTPPKGECVIVVKGGRPEKKTLSEGEAELLIDSLLSEGMSKKSAAAELARRTGISRNEAYKLVTERE